MTTASHHPSSRPLKPIPSELFDGDAIQKGHPLFGLIWINRERLGGTPCFTGSRVPVKTLFDYLESGCSIDQFLDDFDGITVEQVIGVLEKASAGLLAELPKP